MSCQTQAVLIPTATVPGRPERPVLKPAQTMPQRSVNTERGLAAMVHAIAHIEFNAINLALDAVWRFPGHPQAYYLDWWRVAQEEAKHFDMLCIELACGKCARPRPSTGLLAWRWCHARWRREAWTRRP